MFCVPPNHLFVNVKENIIIEFLHVLGIGLLAESDLVISHSSDSAFLYF